MAKMWMQEAVIRRLIEQRGLKTGSYFYDAPSDRMGIEVARQEDIKFESFMLPYDLFRMTVNELDTSFLDEVEDAIYPGGREERAGGKSYSHWGMFAA